MNQDIIPNLYQEYQKLHTRSTTETAGYRQPLNLARSKRPSQNNKKVLILKPSCLGDLLQMTPAIEMLSSQRPDLELSLLTEDDGHTLFSATTQFCKIWHLQRQRWSRSTFDEFNTDILELVKKIKAEKFDLVVNLHHSSRSALLMCLLNPVNHVGLRASSLGQYVKRSTTEQQLLDSFSTYCIEGIRVEETSTLVQRGSNRSQLYKNMFHGAGVNPDLPYSYKLDIKHDKRLFERIGLNQPYTVLATGNSWKSGRWPIEHWKELITGLDDRKLVLVGTDEDRERNNRLCRELPEMDILDLTGKTRVDEFAEIVAHAEMLIGNDSSASHLAAAFNIPAHVLFGSSSPELCAPFSSSLMIHYQHDACHIGPCNKMTCELQDMRCMRALSPASILNEIKTQERLAVSG